MFYNEYRSRPDTLQPTATITGGEDGEEQVGKVYELPGYVVTVWGDGRVTSQVKKRDTKLGDELPNARFVDGQLCFPLEDLIELILMRIPAHELATGLMTDQDARTFMAEAMVNRFSQFSFTDEERRGFLHQIQEQIYAQAVDKMVNGLTAIEEKLRCKSEAHRWNITQLSYYKLLYTQWEEALDRLLFNNLVTPEKVETMKGQVNTPDQLTKMLTLGMDPLIVQTVGKEWRDCREFWRKKIQEMIPLPSAKTDLMAEREEEFWR